MTSYYRDATPENQQMAREIAFYVIQNFRQTMAPVSPLPKAPEGYSIAFKPDTFVTIELRKKEPGVTLRLSGTENILRRHGAPKALRAEEGTSFVRVYVERMEDLSPARRWIDAAARARGVEDARGNRPQREAAESR